MQNTIYLLNGPVIGFIDLSLQKQDVTPLIATMPPGWNQPRTRIRIRFIGTFQLPLNGDLFIRKFWMGKTQICKVTTCGIRPGESRTFRDDIDILWTGDNLHAIHAVHHTGVVGSGSFTTGEGNTGNTEYFRDAFPATSELTNNDAPPIIDGNLNNVAPSFYAISQDAKAKVAFSIRELAIEQIEI